MKGTRVVVLVGSVGLLVLLFLMGMKANSAAGRSGRYGETLCGDTTKYQCLTVSVREIETEVQTKKGPKIVKKKKTDTWESLWPDAREREIVMKLNRMNIGLWKGLILAVPKDMTGKNFMDFSPYPYQIDPPGEKLLIWDPALLAWAAYDPQGQLVRWGPGVGGKDYCPDVGRSCRTVVGTFRIISKHGPNYRSSTYPVGCQGNRCARMPYAMFFRSGYAFHASSNVPGMNASHGCVRLFYEDAKWLNQNFAEIGTKVIIRPYPKRK